MNLPETAENSQQGKLKVLVADDERAIAETLRIILTQHGFEAEAVYGGRAAIDVARHWTPDIYLGDVVMPDLDGIEAAIQIQAICPACRVMLFSGQAVVRDLLAEARMNGHEFELVVKPIHPTELLERLRAAY